MDITNLNEEIHQLLDSHLIPGNWYIPEGGYFACEFIREDEDGYVFKSLGGKEVKYSKDLYFRTYLMKNKAPINIVKQQPKELVMA